MTQRSFVEIRVAQHERARRLAGARCARVVHDEIVERYVGRRVFGGGERRSERRVQEVALIERGSPVGPRKPHHLASIQLETHEV